VENCTGAKEKDADAMENIKCRAQTHQVGYVILAGSATVVLLFI